MSDFRPTHRITLTSARGKRKVVAVRLDEQDASGAGPAYTREEWKDGEPADWEFAPGDGWTFQGRPLPGGYSKISVRRIAKLSRT